MRGAKLALGMLAVTLALADKLNHDVVAALRQAQTIRTTKALGMALAGGSRAEAAKFLTAERIL